ncbi:C4-dicarboxylate transporter DcuC [Sporomusa sphaeroides]|uniref:C4-dicarboxylate transporter DcuC n=1 Tax=Sporomusa sphaeroides TaxID=47679 RepID=UPI002C6C91E5|nr:C4-dicarboxylate transporter DcuC [Sporomusa sphaeroides]HML33204.1 C4-dicarboxylate transporter DcuC [Sporomusa sphaeroides]
MLGLMLALFSIILVGFLIIKKYKPQPVLLMAGFLLMSCAIVFDMHNILPTKESTGFVWFDIFEVLKNTFSTRAAGLGLNIMVVGGFARYMDYIGASKVLAQMVVKPIGKLRAPYVVLAMSYILGQLLGLFINSASGLSLLLMVTLYPILVNLGVSKLSAATVIATTLCLDWSPTDAGSILAANTAGIDIATYWIKYQVPVSIAVMSSVAILHFIVQKWYDKKSGHVPQDIEFDDSIISNNLPPKIYILIPLIPLLLILFFNDLIISSIKMNLIIAVFISILVAMLFEYIRYYDSHKLFNDLQVFFDGMGAEFSSVVTLIVAGEIFAKGLQTVGAIDTIINFAHLLGFSYIGMLLVMVSLIALCSVIMGGNSPFYAFVSLIPTVAAKIAVMPVLLILPLHFASSIARSMSPIAAVIIVVAGMSNLPTMEIVKRASIPMCVALIVNVVATLMIC